MKNIGVMIVLLFVFSISGICEVPATLGKVIPLKGIPFIKAEHNIEITGPTDIKVNDVLITGDNVLAKVHFLDGSFFKIQSNAKITFKSTSIHIKRGNVFLKLIKRGKKFKVYTPTATIGVYGTSFAIMMDDIASTVVALYTGKVQVGGVTGSKKSTILNAGQMTKVGMNGIPSSPQPIKDTIKKYWKQFDAFLKKNKKILNPLIKMVKKMEKKDIKKIADQVADVTGKPEISDLVDNGLESVLEEINKYGDLDGDGKVTLKDRAILYEYVKKNGKLTEKQKRFADVDGDGNIDKIDLNLIKLVAENSGDLNDDGYADDLDIQLMEDLIVAGTYDKKFDFGLNGKVDQYDLNLLRYYIKERAKYIGR